MKSGAALKEQDTFPGTLRVTCRVAKRHPILRTLRLPTAFFSFIGEALNLNFWVNFIQQVLPIHGEYNKLTC